MTKFTAPELPAPPPWFWSPFPSANICALSSEVVELDPAFGSIYAEGFSISPNGQQLSGTYFTGQPIDHSGPFHAFFRTPDGLPGSWAFSSADFPNGQNKAMSGRAINDNNDRAGFFVDKNDIVPFIWWGNAANPARFVLEGAQLHADLHSGLIPNSVFAINNDGFVAGAYTGANGLVGFVVNGKAADAQNTFTIVDCKGLGATRVLIRALNSAREIVGRVDVLNGTFGLVSLDVTAD